MIVAHNDDKNLFDDLINRSVNELTRESAERQEYFLTRGGVNLEKDIHSIFQKNAKGTIYEDNIELISGQKFPDIVAYVNQNKAFGVEVKTSKQKKWKSTGSSIFEGTRVPDVEKIYLLFGKLVEPVEFRWKPYEECLYDVAITHSPRYLIDMDTEKDSTIFAKVGVDYDQLRKLSNPFDPIKKYLRSNLKEGSDLWWIDSNDESSRSLEVQSWSSLPASKKAYLKAIGLALFPKILSSSPDKYHRFATYLVSQHGVVSHSLRDSFTAGGRVKLHGVSCPKIFQRLETHIDKIYEFIYQCDENDLLYYWSDKSMSLDYIETDRFAQWGQLVETYALQNNKINQEQAGVLKALLMRD